MDLGKFVSDIKSKTIDPLLEEQAVAHLDGQLKRYQQETGNRLTDADFEEVNKSLTPDKIQSGYYVKEAIRDAIRSVPIAGKTIAGGVKAAAEIPALMLEIPKALYGASKAVPSPAELMMDTFAGRERVKRELDPVSQGLAQAGKFTRDLASDVTGVGEGQGFQDLPTGIGTAAGALVGGAAYLKAIGAATEGAAAANIFKDLTAKGIASTVTKDLTAKGIAKAAAEAGTKRFIAGTAANTIAGSPLSLAASMNDDGSIDPNALALNLTIDTAFGGAIEGTGALLTKNYGKQALREAGRMAQGGEGFIFRGNSKESLKGIAETNRAFNRRNVEAYKAKGLNEARAAEEAKLAAAQKYEKIESDLMQARSLTEQRQGQLADEQARLGLKDETRQNVSVLNDIYEAEKQTAFKQIDAEQDKLVSEIQRESEQKTKDLVKQKADIDKQERTLTKPFDLEEKNLAKQQKQVNDSYQRAKKQAETEPVQMEAEPLADEEILALPEIKEANKGFQTLQKDLSSQVKTKITNIKTAAKEKVAKFQEQLANAQKGYDDFLARQASTTSYKNEPARRAAEGRAAKAKAKFENYKKLHAEKIAQLKETVAKQIDTVKTKQQQALEAKQAEIGQLKADLETKRLQDIELQKQQIKEQRLKALDDEYNAARSDVDTRLSVTNANRNQAVSEFQAKKQALLEQQQKLEQELKDKVDYLNRRREVLKKQKEVALNRQFKKDALREYRAKMGVETPVLRNADDIEVDRMIAKEELDQIDSQLAELRNKANPPEPSGLKTGTVAQTGEEFYKDMQRIYNKVAGKDNPNIEFIEVDSEIPTKGLKVKVDKEGKVRSEYQGDNPVMKSLVGTGDLLNDFIKPVISVIRDVNSIVAGKIRKLQYVSSKRVNQKMIPIANLQTKLKQFATKEERKIFDFYFLKNDRESLRTLMSKIDARGGEYKELPAFIRIPLKLIEAEDTARDFQQQINRPLTELLEDTFKVFDDLYPELQQSGREIGFRQNYLPTAVKREKLEEWRTLLGVTPAERNAFDKALAAEKKRLGHDLDEVETAELLNKFLSGYRGTTSIPNLGNYNERTGIMQALLEAKGNDLTYLNSKNKEQYFTDLYQDPFEAMKNYIERSVYDIESRKFFGKAKPEIDPETGLPKVNLKDDIGSYVSQLLTNGQIKNSDVTKLEDALGALFIEGPRKPAELARFAKDFSALGALNDFMSSVIQLNELAVSAYRNGLLNTIKGLGQSLTPDGIKTLDVAVQRIGVDYTQAPSMIRGITEMYLKLDGFKAMNKVMQEANLNSSFNYFQKVFKKGKGGAFDREYSNLQALFGAEEADKMVQAFRTKSLKESYDDFNIGLALFDRLSATQVTSLADLPKAYLNNPNMRFFYTLKSFALKQFQLVKDDVYVKFAKSIKSMATEGINTKNTKEAGLAIRNAVALSVVVGGNYSVNYLRDMVQGKTSEEYQSMEERLQEAILQTYFPLINPYIFYKFDKEGPVSAVGSMVSPAFRILNDLEKDYQKAARAGRKGEDYDPWTSKTFYNMIPVGGKTLYSHSPTGREEYGKVIEAKAKDRATKEENEKEKEFAKLRGY